jgi:hypothetical protein
MATRIILEVLCRDEDATTVQEVLYEAVDGLNQGWYEDTEAIPVLQVTFGPVQGIPKEHMDIDESELKNFIDNDWGACGP